MCHGFFSNRKCFWIGCLKIRKTLYLQMAKLLAKFGDFFVDQRLVVMSDRQIARVFRRDEWYPFLRLIFDEIFFKDSKCDGINLIQCKIEFWFGFLRKIFYFVPARSRVVLLHQFQSIAIVIGRLSCDFCDDRILHLIWNRREKPRF